MSRTVVFIDDEAGLCRSFGAMARRAGLEVATFTDPRLALIFIRDNDVAAVVCDYRMPELNGLQVLEQLDGSPPFYLVSGDLGVEQFGSRPGITAVIAKPFSQKALVERLRVHVTPAVR